MTTEPTVELALGSFNAHCGRDPTGALYSVSTAIRRISADVVVVQENWRPTAADSVARKAAVECGYSELIELEVLGGTSLYDLGVVTAAAASEVGSWGLAVLSRLPVIRHENVWLGRAPGDVGSRAAQITEIRVAAGLVVRVVNVHLTHRLRYGPGQLRCLLRAIEPDHTPTVIAGDFNMSRPMIYLARSYRPAARGRTWPVKHPVLQLDHVLVSHGIEVTDQQVIPAAGSDHLPVRVALRVARGQAG